MYLLRGPSCKSTREETVGHKIQEVQSYKSTENDGKIEEKEEIFEEEEEIFEEEGSEENAKELIS